MSQLADLMARVGMPAFRRVAGDAVTYTPAGGDPVTTWAVFQHSSALVGQYAPLLENRLMAKIPVEDVPTPQSGDSLTVTTSGKTYRIDQPTESNAFFTTVTLL